MLHKEFATKPALAQALGVETNQITRLGPNVHQVADQIYLVLDNEKAIDCLESVFYAKYRKHFENLVSAEFAKYIKIDLDSLVFDQLQKLDPETKARIVVSEWFAAERDHVSQIWTRYGNLDFTVYLTK
jgi:hypothetical protein